MIKLQMISTRDGVIGESPHWYKKYPYSQQAIYHSVSSWRQGAIVHMQSGHLYSCCTWQCQGLSILFGVVDGGGLGTLIEAKKTIVSAIVGTLFIYPMRS